MRTALIKTTAASRLDCSTMSTVSSINIDATIPTGCALYVVTKTANGNWQKYNTATNKWADVATQNLTPNSVILEGNTKAEIEALNSTALAPIGGKVVNFTVALKMDDTATEPPSISAITVSGKTGATVTTEKIESDVIPLSASGKSAVDILDIKVDKEESNGGTVDVKASIQTIGGNWSDYKDYTEYLTAAPTQALAIKFQAILKAPTVGSSVATLKSVTINHRTDSVAVFSEGSGVLVSKTYNFVNNITQAHLMIKHPLIKDTSFTAEIALRKPPTTVTGEALGTGNGARQTFTLKNKEGLASHGFALYFDGAKQDASKYAYSPTDGHVSCTAPDGVAVTADYIYGWSAEKFVPMTKDTIYPDKDDNNFVDEQFDYIAAKPTDPIGSVGTIRVNIIQGTGTVKDEVLGTATGESQAFTLAHHAKEETLKVAGAKSYKYNPNIDVLQVTGEKGAVISVSYDWAARPNYAESEVCVFNE